MGEIARDRVDVGAHYQMGGQTSQVIDYLERFSRKERFMLLSHALGQEDGKRPFFLNRVFQETLGREIDVLVPYDAFVAMDFHLDWLQMALYLADHGDSLSCAIPNDHLVKGNQEDVDLLIAFKDQCTNETHLVLVEAKADTGWTNKQLRSKACRLDLIFDKHSYGSELVRSHFVLMSPHRPTGIKTDTWPHWMKNARVDGSDSPIRWLPLPLRDGLLKVTRCDKEKKPARDGEHLFIREYKEKGWRSIGV